jgi:hypothetical protein
MEVPLYYDETTLWAKSGIFAVWYNVVFSHLHLMYPLEGRIWMYTRIQTYPFK